jgi:hypothetical protein
MILFGLLAADVFVPFAGDFLRLLLQMFLLLLLRKLRKLESYKCN